MKIFHFDCSSKRLSFVWAFSLSACFLLFWLIGYFFATDSGSGTDIGSIVGLTLGGAIGGLGIALKLRAKLSGLNLISVIFISLGWALAMFTIAGLELVVFRNFVN